MTVGTILLLWGVLVLSFPACDINLDRIQRYVTGAYVAFKWEPPPGQTELPYRPSKGTEEAPDEEWKKDSIRMRPQVPPFPAGDAGWLAGALFAVGLTWRHVRTSEKSRKGQLRT